MLNNLYINCIVDRAYTVTETQIIRTLALGTSYSRHMTSLQDYTFEWLAQKQNPLINKFYQQHAIRGKASRSDRCAVLRDMNLDIVAVAILKDKQHYELLTHVGVVRNLRRIGLATYLMSLMAGQFTSKTYCFPFTHLEALYFSQGFVKIETSDASNEVVRQFQVYRKQGRDILLMQYKTSKDLSFDNN